MFDSDILNLFIGLSFVYFFLSLICMWIQEIINNGLQIKAKNIVSVIQNLLDPKPGTKQPKVKITYEGTKKAVWRYLTTTGEKMNANIVKTFFEHHRIASLYKDKRLPTKITGKEFSIVLYEMLKEAATDKRKGKNELEVLLNGADKLENESTKSVIKSIIENTEPDNQDISKRCKAIQQSFESWYNSSRESASEWYKRNIRKSVVIISFVVAFLFNADSIDMFKVLWNQPALSTAISEVAINYVENKSNDMKDANDISTRIKEVNNELNTVKGIDSLLGWDNWYEKNKENISWSWEFIRLLLFKLFGLAITTFGISQGSSFWYDALKRFVGLRSAASNQNTGNPA